MTYEQRQDAIDATYEAKLSNLPIGDNRQLWWMRTMDEWKLMKQLEEQCERDE